MRNETNKEETMQNGFRMIDSYSDGMCGWVQYQYAGNEVKVRWSVTGRITSQSEAINEAERLLEEMA